MWPPPTNSSPLIDHMRVTALAAGHVQQPAGGLAAVLTFVSGISLQPVCVYVCPLRLQPGGDSCVCLRAAGRLALSEPCPNFWVAFPCIKGVKFYQGTDTSLDQRLPAHVFRSV